MAQPMRKFLPTSLLLSLFALAVPVSDAHAQSEVPASSRVKRGSQPETPERLYATGLRQMKLGSWDEAILSFERVRNHFPFNQYSVLSELRVADCLYEKGSYLEAADAYRGFARLHPRHAEMDYVVYRSARSDFKLAPNVAQRDQTHTRRGLRRLRAFEGRFPSSEYLPEVLKLRARAGRRLSRAAVAIGNFYWKQKQWAAAERRYRLAVEEFPDSPLIPRARFRRGLCLWELGAAATEPEDQTRLRQDALSLIERVAGEQSDSRLGKKAQRFVDEHPAAISTDPGEVKVSGS
jgi:outer membrane protein assembly factor BamD